MRASLVRPPHVSMWTRVSPRKPRKRRHLRCRSSLQPKRFHQSPWPLHARCRRVASSGRRRNQPRLSRRSRQGSAPQPESHMLLPAAPKFHLSWRASLVLESLPVCGPRHRDDTVGNVPCVNSHPPINAEVVLRRKGKPTSYRPVSDATKAPSSPEASMKLAGSLSSKVLRYFA